MTSSPQPRAEAPYWSLAGLWEGARLTMPVVPGTIVFATAYGTLAGQKGLTLTEVVLMNAIVFAGTSQLVALEIWSYPLTLGTIASLALVTAIVNARFFLMTASLRPWMGSLPAWQVYPTLLLTTDGTWIVAARYHANGGMDASVYLGSGLTLWALWTAAAIPGYLAGGLISDPARYGFDLMLPIFFTALTVPMWRGARRAIGWAVAGVVALAVSWLVPGYWFIVVGAVAGSIAGGFIDDE